MSKHQIDRAHEQKPRVRAPRVPREHLSHLDACIEGAVRECAAAFMATTGLADGTRSRQIVAWSREFEATVRAAERAA